jgi:acyl carrier protein
MGQQAGIEAKVLQAVIATLPGVTSSDLDAETELFGIGLDSVNAVELVLRLEDEFGIEFGLDEIEYDNFRTVSSISDLIRNKAR